MDNDTNTSKKSVIKYLLNMIVLVLLIWITFHLLLKDQDLGELITIIRNAKLKYVLSGMLCMMAFFTCEAINMRRTLIAVGEKCTLLQAIKYALIGIFFSDITPAASGGQPMQVLYMRKDGIKVSSSTIALVLNLLSFQTLTIGLGILSALILCRSLDIAIIIMLIIGVLLNSVSLSLVLIGIFSEKLSAGLVGFVAKILKKFKIKNYEEKEKALQESLASYHESAKYIRSNKSILVKQFSIAIIQQVLYYSVPFFVLCAFGVPMQNYLYMVALQSIVFAMVSGIPLPGAVGVSETAFVNIYLMIFTEEYINGAMILSRGISFYVPLIISAIVVIAATVKSNKKSRRDIWNKVLKKLT